MLLTLARFRLTLYSPLIPVLGVDGPGDGVQGGLGVGDQEAAEAEQRQGEEAVGRQHQQARAQGAAGATQGPQTSATIILDMKNSTWNRRNAVLGGIVVFPQSP